MQQDINIDIFPHQYEIECKAIIQQLEEEIAPLPIQEQIETRERIKRQIDARRTYEAYESIKHKGAWTCSVCRQEQNANISLPNFVWLKEDPSRETIICNACHHNATKEHSIDKEVKVADDGVKMY
jgi:transcription elongation factor Elf1